MNGPEPVYADICDYGNLVAVAESGTPEEHIADLRSRLVRRRYHPRECPEDDEIVCRAIERAAAAKHTRLREVKDSELLGLIGVLF